MIYLAIALGAFAGLLIVAGLVELLIRLFEQHCLHRKWARRRLRRMLWP